MSIKDIYLYVYAVNHLLFASDIRENEHLANIKRRMYVAYSHREIKTPRIKNRTP